MNHECVLATLPGANDTQQVVVVLRQLADGSSKVSLRQQTWGDGIGWYDQHSLDLEPEQFRQLRHGLGAPTRPARAEPDSKTILPFPGVTRVESA